jgi:hypothetical protein
MRKRREHVKASSIRKGALIAALAVAGALIIQPPVPAFAGDATGIIFGRLNDKVMGKSWGGEGKLIVFAGDSNKHKKTFEMCPNGYVAAEIDAGKALLDSIKLPKGSSDGFVDRSEAALNQPILMVKPGRATYWGDVKVSYEYGSTVFRSVDKLNDAKTATVACLKAMGNTALAEKLEKAPVDKQLVFANMNER